MRHPICTLHTEKRKEKTGALDAAAIAIGKLLITQTHMKTHAYT